MTDDNKPKEFFCNGCGQIPCTGNCEELCAHGIMKREYCDDCHNKPKEWREQILVDGAPVGHNESGYCGHFPGMTTPMPPPERWLVQSGGDEFVYKEKPTGMLPHEPIQMVPKAALTQAENEVERLKQHRTHTICPQCGNEGVRNNGLAVLDKLAKAEREIASLKHCYNLLDEERERLTKENAELKAELEALNPDGVDWDKHAFLRLTKQNEEQAKEIAAFEQEREDRNLTGPQRLLYKLYRKDKFVSLEAELKAQGEIIAELESALKKFAAKEWVHETPDTTKEALEKLEQWREK